MKYSMKVCNGGLRKDVLLQSLAGCYLNTHEDVEKTTLFMICAPCFVLKVLLLHILMDRGIELPQDFPTHFFIYFFAATMNAEYFLPTFPPPHNRAAFSMPRELYNSVVHKTKNCNLGHQSHISFSYYHLLNHRVLIVQFKYSMTTLPVLTTYYLMVTHIWFWPFFKIYYCNSFQIFCPSTNV